MMRKMKKSSLGVTSVSNEEALAMFEVVDKIMRRFKLEPGLLAGSLYADLHINDVGLVTVLSEPGEWSVRKIAHELGAPDSTISSALNRLEDRGLLVRSHRPGDRRMVHIEVTAAGKRLSAKLRAAHIENCRAMLGWLDPNQRRALIQLAGLVVRD
jgi:DNA-binding MarR family transcriptional regulator